MACHFPLTVFRWETRVFDYEIQPIAVIVIKVFHMSQIKKITHMEKFRADNCSIWTGGNDNNDYSHIS